MDCDKRIIILRRMAGSDWSKLWPDYIVSLRLVLGGEKARKRGKKKKKKKKRKKKKEFGFPLESLIC